MSCVEDHQVVVYYQLSMHTEKPIMITRQIDCDTILTSTSWAWIGFNVHRGHKKLTDYRNDQQANVY